MLNADDIAKIFEWIEMLLIGSLKRNLTRHEAEEKKYGFNWSAWQAEKLRNLDKFRRENAAIVGKYTSTIDKNTRALLEEQFREGVNGAAQEAGEAPEPQPVYMQEIVQPTQPELPEQPEQAQEQPTPETTEQVSTGSPAAADEPIAVIKPEPQFFGVDTVKVNKLVEDMTTMEKQAETAALRLTDDVYRQTVNRVQLAMSTGSMTLNKAIDTAVEDFLNAGINCIEYKDGRRVNIADYVRMALRTTSTRAALQGKSEKYKALGYDTVAVSSYGMCSPTCLPYQGRVYINDAFTSWAGETQIRADGLTYGKSNYCGKWFPLLSSAIAGGLFHPNCRHSISLWRDGDPLPETLDNSETEHRYKLEQQQRELERAIRKAKRKVEGFTDPENIAMAKAQLKEKQKQLREFIDKTNAEEGKEVLRRDSSREKIYKEVKLNSLDDRGIKKESYDSNSAPPQPKQDAPQATQEDNEGSFSTKQNNAVQSSTETFSDNTNKGTNKAKAIELFDDSHAPSEKHISAEQVKDDMQKSEIGRDYLRYVETLEERIIFDYETPMTDTFGEEHNGNIIIYMLNNDSVKRVSRTVIHECTHARYGIGNSQWSECVCIAHELMHKYNRKTLTIAEKRRIISAVKGDSDYKRLNWRKGGFINGRRKSR